MNLTAEQLASALVCHIDRATKWIDALNTAMDEFEINTPKRAAAFVAQIGHESGRLVYVREIWGPTHQQQGYEGRADLGNLYLGDGRKYCGRGLIQITGRANYKTCGDALGLDLESSPQLLEQPLIAARSAAWYWQKHGCNELADAGSFRSITRAINGGLNGLDERIALLETASEAMA